MPDNKPSPFLNLFGALRRGVSPFQPTEMAGYDRPPNVSSKRRATRPHQRTYVPTHDQKMFLEDELKTRGLPFDHVGKVKFVEGYDEDSNEISRYAINDGALAVTQGNTIYVRPGTDFDRVISFEDDTPFEEVYHSSQFRKNGSNANMYAKYALRSAGAALSGKHYYDDNAYEVAAKSAAAEMREAYVSKRRKRWDK